MRAGIGGAMWRPLMVIAAMALGACGSSASSAELPGNRVRRLEAGDSLPNLTRPAGFAGTLPCDGCEGIEAWLVLNPDGSYRLRERRLEGTAAAAVTLGRWHISRDSVPVVSLFAGDTVARRLSLTGALTLRALAADGSAIASEEPSELVRVSMPSDLNAPVSFRGEFRYFADAATLVSCDGGIQFPVTGDSAFLRLQRAHREQLLGTGAAILVDVVGRLQLRPGMEAGDTLETVVVDSFTVVERKQACNATAVHALVAIGDWNLSALDGVKLPELSRERQPTLRFVLSEPTMFGNAGCNRFTGRAVLRGLTLVAQPIGLTKMMCDGEDVMQRESRYAQALGAGGWFRLEAGELVFSRGGTDVARFFRR